MEKKRILINKLIHNIYIQSIVMTVAINWTLGLRTSNPFSIFLLIILCAFQKNETVNLQIAKKQIPKHTGFLSPDTLEQIFTLANL